jgi:hypothetical protein
LSVKISITPVDTPATKNIQPGKYLVMKNAISFYYSVEMHKFMSAPGFPSGFKKATYPPRYFSSIDSG